MVSKINPEKSEAVLNVVEEYLGIDPYDVAIFKSEENILEADCMILSSIPKHTVKRLKQGETVTIDNNTYKVILQNVDEHRQVNFKCTKLN